MTIVALDPATGQQQRRVPIAQAVPGASSNYGYSETSAPICADHRLIVGAAGSEYGVRGFVMAYHTPTSRRPGRTRSGRSRRRAPSGASSARSSAAASSGRRRPSTPTTNTLYFGTGAATPPYYPSLRPGPTRAPTRSIAIDLNTGQMKWWQQQLSFNEWSYDTSQPPMVYTAKIGGKKSGSSRSRRWRASGSPTTRPPARRSTSGSR